MSNTSGKAVKAGIGYTVGNILVKGIGFLTLPLFSRLLTTEEFGVFNVFVSYEAILYVLIGLALHSSVQSAKLEYGEKIDDYVSSISLIYLIAALAALTLALIWRSPLAQWLAFSKGTVILLVLYSFGSAYLTLYNQWLSLNYDYKRYLLVALCGSLGNVGLSLVLILTVFQDDRAMGRIAGAAGSVFVLALALLLRVFAKARPRYRREYWKFGIRYSLPVIPHGIAQVLLAQMDRIMIRAMVGNSAAGIYSLSGNLKLIMAVINESVTTAWRTWFFEEMENERVENIQKHAQTLAALFAALTVGLMAVSPELIMLLGGADYALGKYAAIPMVLDAFVLFLYSLIVQSEYYKKKTSYIMLGTLAAAAINGIANFVCIRRFGFLAAAYTTLFSYVCYLVWHVVISYKVIGFFVLKFEVLLMDVGLVAAAATLNLLCMDRPVLRWGAGVLLCAGMLFRQTVDVRKLFGG